MNKEILLVVEMVSNEKGVDKSVIFDALACALASATKKRFPAESDIIVNIDEHTGSYTTWRRWEVVEDEMIETLDGQITIEDARETHPDIEVGEYIQEQIESEVFGRIASQAARQVIIQKVREAERRQVIDAYAHRQGELISGTVKRIDKGNVIIDLGGNVDAVIYREDLIPREALRPGDRIRAYLKEVRAENRGPQIFLNRVDSELLIQLFTLEVPEINEGYIKILGAARDPGLRAKIAVHATDTRIDPVGACVGMRGSRVQAVSNELNGERVDIILWDENPAKFVINAMSPADVESIVIDEDLHSMDVAVPESQLSLAIGRGGQNVRLASQLTGWTLNVMTTGEAQEKNQGEHQAVAELFMQKLEVDENVAAALIEEGFSHLDEIAYVPFEEMLGMGIFDEETTLELQQRAKDALLTEEIASEETLEKTPSEDLLGLEGMDEELATRLAASGIATMEDLAEQAVDDLMDLGIIDDQTRAAELIMAARAPWFEDEAQD